MGFARNKDIKVIRIKKDISDIDIHNEVPESMLDEIFVVMREDNESYYIDAESYHEGDNFQIFKEEATELTEEEVKDILYRKFIRSNGKLLDY